MSRPNQRFLSAFASIPGAVFVETGTFRGGGVRAALRAGFETVISIEPADAHYRECCARFADQRRSGQVVLIHGPSEERLEGAIADIDRPIVYWLDGHFLGVETGAMNCPIPAEVDVILGRGIAADDVIMIDDVRLLKNNAAWRGHQTDAAREFGRLILAAPGHAALFLDGYTAADIFALAPRSFVSRYPALFGPEM